jgi:hypothetical protein
VAPDSPASARPSSTCGNRINSIRTLPGRGRRADSRRRLSGYIVVSAADADEAARHPSGCPGLDYGISVEIADIGRPDQER